MNPVTFLEQLANNTSYNQEISTLLAQQPTEVQHAFLQNTADTLKNKFPNVEYLANAQCFTGYQTTSNVLTKNNI